MAQANTLINTPVSQNNNIMGHFNAKPAGFKTSNLQIFPSLHPLGGFYNNKKPTQPAASLNEKRELEVTSETAKKQRLNTGLEFSAANSQKVNATVESSLKQVNSQNKKKDDYVFRVPKLPRRLLEQQANNNNVNSNNNNNKTQEVKVNVPVNLGTTYSDDLTMKDDLINYNFNAQPTKKSKTTRKSVKKTETVIEPQHEIIGLVDQGVDQAWLSAVYEKLMYDYYAFQLEQQAQQYLAQLTGSNIYKGQDVKSMIHC